MNDCLTRNCVSFAQVVATSLNSTVAFTDLIKYNTPTMAPVVKKTAA